MIVRSFIYIMQVACLSPALANIEDTLSTLHYAQRAKRISNRPTVQLSEKDQIVHNLKAEVAALTAENKFLRSVFFGSGLRRFYDFAYLMCFRHKLASYGDSAAISLPGHARGESFNAPTPPAHGTPRSRYTQILSLIAEL